jgi:DNA-binding response OmpR family regulator
MAVIVVAEDELHIARVVSLWLAKSGHRVHVAHDGRAALGLVQDLEPDLLISDVNMPVMDGIELVTTCAAHHLPKVGIIMLTSRCDQMEIRERIKGLKVSLHPKPFSPSQLTGEVERLLAGAAKDRPPVHDKETYRQHDVHAM